MIVCKLRNYVLDLEKSECLDLCNSDYIRYAEGKTEPENPILKHVKRSLEYFLLTVEAYGTLCVKG